MTDRTKALDELIAGDADLYDVPPEAMVDEWLAECTDGRVSSHTITMLRTFARWNDARHRIASARITGDKDRRESQSSAPTEPVAFEFDRYVNGVLMAEGVAIERAKTLDQAILKAVKIAARMSQARTVLVLRGAPQ
jgi:hypothetical protein